VIAIGTAEGLIDETLLDGDTTLVTITDARVLVPR
jgi:hypothetical protein